MDNKATTDGNSRPEFTKKEMYTLRQRIGSSEYCKRVHFFVLDTQNIPATQLSMAKLAWLWKIKDSLTKKET